MLERDRLESKKISKTQAVTSNMEHDLGARNVHIGPSDYVQWLDDRKWAYVRLEGRAFGDVPLNLEYKLEVWDSPNSAGVIIDAIRCAKIAKDRGIGGPILSASSYFMKSPPEQHPDDMARDLGGGVHPRRDRALATEWSARNEPPAEATYAEVAHGMARSSADPPLGSTCTTGRPGSPTGAGSFCVLAGRTDVRP